MSAGLSKICKISVAAVPVDFPARPMNSLPAENPRMKADMAAADRLTSDAPRKASSAR